jgi:hypothetical protein
MAKSRPRRRRRQQRRARAREGRRRPARAHGLTPVRRDERLERTHDVAWTHLPPRGARRHLGAASGTQGGRRPGRPSASHGTLRAMGARPCPGAPKSRGEASLVGDGSRGPGPRGGGPRCSRRGGPHKGRRDLRQPARRFGGGRAHSYRVAAPYASGSPRARAARAPGGPERPRRQGFVDLPACGGPGRQAGTPARFPYQGQRGRAARGFPHRREHARGASVRRALSPSHSRTSTRARRRSPP